VSSRKPDIILEVGGQRYGGWKSIDISRGLEQCAGTFRLSVTDRWPQQNEPRGIKAGAACRVTIDGRAVITGYVDDVEVSWSATSHEYRVSGRDKTADLVDCCPPSLQLKGADLPALARRWAGLFGIEVMVEAECNKAVPGFKTEEGETCFEMLERLARANAVMLTSDGDGRLVITRAGTRKAAAALQMGGNLLRLALSSSMKDRFSEVTVKGQSAGSDTWDGPGNAQAKGTATDPNVLRYRPLTVIAEQEEFGSAATRARHEVAVRYGKGHQARALVNGWYAGTELWQPNRLADILDGSGQAMATWLIVNVSWHMPCPPRKPTNCCPRCPRGQRAKKARRPRYGCNDPRAPPALPATAHGHPGWPCRAIGRQFRNRPAKRAGAHPGRRGHGRGGTYGAVWLH